ncbi:hypothetical protein [Microbacterium sp. LWH10-1.2]|uniref:hypothetical protein n=1 Tax=Microbacterium sp. LWH10-1.2 TaxID=3135255 RepID=UPI0031391F78
MTRRVSSLVAIPMVALILIGCVPDVRSEAEGVLVEQVTSSVYMMRLHLVDTKENSEVDLSVFSDMADVTLLDRIEAPRSAPASTLFCLEQHGDEIDACMFYPALVRTQTGLSDTESNLYGCARLRGSLGASTIAAEDIACPDELIAWAEDAVVLEPPRSVSIVEIAGRRFEEDS